MKTVRAILPVLMLLGAHPADASDLRIVAFYMCKAAAITEKTIELCTKTYPDLTKRGRSALEGWRERNAKDAAEAAANCEAEIREQAANDEAKVQQIKGRLEAFDSEYWAAFNQKLESNGLVVCTEFISMTEQPAGDLSKLLNQ